MKKKALSRLAALASVTTVVGLVVPIVAATSASAAEPTGLVASPSSANVSTNSSFSFTVTPTPSGTLTAKNVDWTIQSGPDFNAGQPLKGTSCGVPNPTTNSYTCTVPSGSQTGTDTVLFFIDEAGTGTYDRSLDPSTTSQLIITGPTARLAVSPTSASAASNMCAPYSATATDSSGNPAVGQTVYVELSQASTGTPAHFCDPSSTAYPAANAAPGGTVDNPPASDGTTETAVDHFTTGNGTGGTTPGQFTFGVTSSQGGTVAITVANSNPKASTPSISANASLTVNATQANVNNSASSVSVSPSTQSVFPNKPVNTTVTVRDSQGDLLGGVTVSEAVTAGPDSGTAAACGTTDQTGTTTCNYTAGSATGTDTITAWVNQSNHATNTTGLDPGEPSGTATANIVTEPSFHGITSTCDAGCTVNTTQGTEAVTFTLTQNTVQGGTIPSPGYQLNFSLSDTSKYKLSAKSCVTDNNGQCTVSVTDSSPVDGDNVFIRASLASDPSVQDNSAHVVWSVSRISTGTIVIDPPAESTTFGSVVTHKATVKDTFGNPVANDIVSWSVTPDALAGNTTGGACVTDSTGSCSFSYTDTSPVTNQNRTDDITATAHNGTVNGMPDTNSLTVFEYFVIGDAKAHQLNIDVPSNQAFCDGSYRTGAPYTSPYPAENFTANSSPVATGRTVPVCAGVVDLNGNRLLGKAITFTTSGVGGFVDKVKHQPLGTSSIVVHVYDGNGNAFVNTPSGTDFVNLAEVFVSSTTAGTENLTASVDGLTSSGTMNWVQGYTPVNPTRIVDTRSGAGGVQGPGYAGGALNPNTLYGFSTTGAGIPAGAQAVALNITGIHPDNVGNLRVDGNCSDSGNFFVSGGVPQTSLVNYQQGHDIANFVVLPINANNEFFFGGNCIQLYSDNAHVNVAIDLVGVYYTGFERPQTNFREPTRVADTRSGLGGTSGQIPAGTSASFSMTASNAVPVGAKAVGINVTTVNPKGLGNLRVYPDGAPVPNASNVNYIPGVDKSAFVVVNLPDDGKINVFTDGVPATVVVDVFGYYDSPATNQFNVANLVTQAPVRILDTRSSSTSGGLPTPLAANTPYTFQVSGMGNVPSNAQAVLVSLTSVHAPGSTGIGNLRLFPAGESLPTVSNINYVSPTADVANFAIVKLPASGQLTLYSDGSPINALVDVVGWVPPGA